MFDMRITGLKISELRKERNMTQMELADKMNISFQAVSNWERGNSMPDVAKLPELAQIFNVTVDDLLNESSALVSSAAKEELVQYLSSNEVSVEELQQAAPILKPKQIEEVVTHMKIQSLREIDGVLPFLEKNLLNELALKALDKEDYMGLDSIAPFVEQGVIDKIAAKMVSEKKHIGGIAPFINKTILTECAENIYKEQGLSGLGEIAPFLDKAYLNELAKAAIQKEGLSAICPIAPFLDKKMLSDLIREAY